MELKLLVTGVVVLVAVGGATLPAESGFSQAPRRAVTRVQPGAAPVHRVVAYYFHRTKRCPTCQRISAYTEEALKRVFAKELKDGRVRLYMIDFQDPKNRRYAKCYKITKPTLVVNDVHKEKVTRWKPLPKVWSLVFKKEKFFDYVQNEVLSYLKEK